MRISDTISLSVRMFRMRPMRTLLTILGIGVGIGTVLFLVSIGYGLQRSILERIATADMLLTMDVRAGSDNTRLTEQSVKGFFKLIGVVAVARHQELSSQATFGSLVSDLPVSAVDPSFFKLSGIETSNGVLFTDEHERATILTSAAMPLFGAEAEELVGTSIVLTIRTDGGSGSTATTASGVYRIAGIVQNDQESHAYIPFQSLEPSDNTFDLVKVKVREQNLLEPIRNAIIRQGYIVSAVSDIIEQANSIFRVSQIILGLFGLVAIIVSAIGMFNTMTITLLERTNEIGIMRAIGITPSDIRRIFLIESMLMGFLGGAFGIVMGLVAGETLNVLVNLLAARFGGPPIDIFYAPQWFVLFVLIFSAIIGFLTGVYPSICASRLNPLDALRYK